MDEVKNFHIFVEGRVQGVGFRRFVAKIAQEFQVCGWTRNRSDGRVEIMATGAAVYMEKFLLEIKKGPSLSNVRKLEIYSVLSTQEKGFQILADEESTGI